MNRAIFYETVIVLLALALLVACSSESPFIEKHDGQPYLCRPFNDEQGRTAKVVCSEYEWHRYVEPGPTSALYVPKGVTLEAWNCQWTFNTSDPLGTDCPKGWICDVLMVMHPPKTKVRGDLLCDPSASRPGLGLDCGRVLHNTVLDLTGPDCHKQPCRGDDIR